MARSFLPSPLYEAWPLVMELFLRLPKQCCHGDKRLLAGAASGKFLAPAPVFVVREFIISKYFFLSNIILGHDLISDLVSQNTLSRVKKYRYHLNIYVSNLTLLSM